MWREQTEDVLVIWLYHREHCRADVLRRSLLFPPRIWLKAPVNKGGISKSLSDKHASTRPGVVSLCSISLFHFLLVCSGCQIPLASPFMVLSPVFSLSVCPHQSLWGVICGGIKPLSAGPMGSLPCRHVAILNTLRCTQACTVMYADVFVHMF